jgi:hypothetical protein
MWRLIGIIGLIVMCAGLDLLWQSRREVGFWVVTFVEIFRALLQNHQPRDVVKASRSLPRHSHAVRVLVGASLVLIVGPILLALGVTLMFFDPNL